MESDMIVTRGALISAFGIGEVVMGEGRAGVDSPIERSFYRSG